MENPNHRLIAAVAGRLQQLADEVVVIGGSVVDLYADRPVFSHEIRPTKDVDIVIHAVTYGDLADFEEKLLQKGFQRTMNDEVPCRFRFTDELILDVLSTRAIGWSSSNRWIELGFPKAIPVKVSGHWIKILPFAYFLSTKFEAFRGRGAADPYRSHDFEDIVALLDLNSEWVAHLQSADPEVGDFIRGQFSTILASPQLLEVVEGNLPYQDQAERRERIVRGMRSVVAGDGLGEAKPDA